MQNKLSSHESSDENEVSVFNIRFISVRTRSIFESVLTLAVVYCFMIGICSIDEILVGRSFNLKKNISMITECKDGTYGYKCVNNCSGHCMNNSLCNKQTGHCDGGCRPGYTNIHCMDDCI